MKTPVLAAFVMALTLCIGSSAFADNKTDKSIFPDSWMPWKDPENPGVIVLEKNSRTGWLQRRDTSKDPKREPGPINPQRYEYGFNTHGFPTFFGAPLAFNTEDLKAGNVDVALFGSAIDAQYVQGAKFAANRMRALHDIYFWPLGASTDTVNRVDYMDILNLVDYGNAAANMSQNQTSLEEMAKLIVEIIDGGAIPVSIGGTHAQMYAWFMALGKIYGPDGYAVYHFDAHYDTQAPSQGIFVHNGSMIREAVERGLVRGENIVQFGLRSPVPDRSELDWMTKYKLRYHFHAEQEARGFKYVANRVFKELKGKKVFITFDMDGINPGEAPGIGSMAIGGPSAWQAAYLVRGIAHQNEIVGAEFGEYNPLLDDQHHTTGIVMDRMIRAFLGGVAGRRVGITDPNYIAPEALDHGLD